MDSKPFYDLIRDSTSFHWTQEHEKFSKRSRMELVKIKFLPSHQLSILFISTWIRLTWEPDVFQSNNSRKGSGSSASILIISIKQNKKCPHCAGSCVGLSQSYKLTSITLLDLLFQYICIVTINSSSTYRETRDNYLTASFDIGL